MSLILVSIPRTSEEAVGEQATLGLDEKGFLWIYCGIILLLFVVSIARFQAMAQTFTNTSFALHNSLFNAVLRAPMRFFELNSPGKTFSAQKICL